MCYVWVGERNMSANIHILLHLPEVVEDLGPLWAHSCFPFETANGELLKLFHGSQSVDKQVIMLLLARCPKIYKEIDFVI